MTSGRTGHWTKMHQSLVKFSESEASNHTPSLADFTTTTPELKFSVHTGIESGCFALTRSRLNPKRPPTEAAYFSVFECNFDLFWPLASHCHFTEIDISEKRSLSISVNVDARAINFSVSKSTLRLIKESNSHLLSHRTSPIQDDPLKDSR